MVKRFRLWEASAALGVQAQDSPARSTMANASHNNSFISMSEAIPRQGTVDLADPFPAEGRKRQLIVAVTANSAECEKVNDGGFDEICSKPLSRADIHKVISRNFQYE